MNLLCHASGHVAAPLVLENQGFLFSRCQRCRHDLIRSAPSVVGSAGDSWTGVPEGLRVAWRSADVSAFDQPSWIRQSLRRIRERGQQSATAVSDAAQVALAVVGWHATDAARRAKDTTLAAYRSGRRVIRLPRPARPPHAGIVIINLTMNRDPSWQDAVRTDTQFGDMIGA
ncbi:hypothetical protein [Sphingomonas sp. PP-CC-3A-396]|uniref:hypothetical protein n=1 Tax=Sphingomonas sp. PP-CC-3A-396 TaxID=2135655 RepID=UPI0010434D8E|nr:hypothetical protein [Sphingomonas sp. PP-CC-3A-396]TCQ10709.1 hypothetical protein C8J40_10191 [Sphingomonas sp. PP-CC-3A-396]